MVAPHDPATHTQLTGTQWVTGQDYLTRGYPAPFKAGLERYRVGNLKLCEEGPHAGDALAHDWCSHGSHFDFADTEPSDPSLSSTYSTSCLYRLSGLICR